MSLLDNTYSFSSASTSIAQDVTIMGGYPLNDQRFLGSFRSAWSNEIEPTGIETLIAAYPAPDDSNTSGHLDGQKFLVGYRKPEWDSEFQLPFIATALTPSESVMAGGKRFRLDGTGANSSPSEAIFTNEIIPLVYRPEVGKSYYWVGSASVIQVLRVDGEGFDYRRIFMSAQARITGRCESSMTRVRFSAMTVAEPLIEVCESRAMNPVIVPRQQDHTVVDELVTAYVGAERVPLGEISPNVEYLVKGAGRGGMEDKWLIGRFDLDGDLCDSREVIQVDHTGVVLGDGGRSYSSIRAAVDEMSLDEAPLTVYTLNPALPQYLDGYHDSASRLELLTPRGVRARIEKIEEMHDELSEALNEEADSQGWCPEFEDSVRPFGFPGRERMNNVDWDVRIHYEAYTDSTREIDGSLRGDIESELGIEGEVSFMEIVHLNFSGEVTVTVTASRNSDHSDLHELIETWQVRDAIDALVNIEVNDWSVVDADINE